PEGRNARAKVCGTRPGDFPDRDRPGGSLIRHIGLQLTQAGRTRLLKQAFERNGLFLFLVLVEEALDAAFSVDQLCLSGEKRMAIGADLDLDVRLYGASLDDVAACARNRGFNVFWMNCLFHITPRNNRYDYSGQYGP